MAEVTAAKAEAQRAATDKAANDARSADVQRQTRSASVEGAQSVAEAVKRVADAAVAAAQRVQPTDTDLDFDFSGTPGGTFTIDGYNLSSGGVVRISGVQAHTREWSTSRIVGDMPANVYPGIVEVVIDENTIRRGRYKA